MDESQALCCYVDEDLDFRKNMVVVKGVLGWGWIKVMFVRWFIPKFYQKCIRTLRLVTVENSTYLVLLVQPKK